jgi:hypothetical protein
MLVQGFHEKLLTKNTIRDCHRDKCFRYYQLVQRGSGQRLSCSFVSIKYMCYISRIAVAFLERYHVKSRFSNK